MIKMVFFDADGTLWTFKRLEHEEEIRNRTLSEAKIDPHVRQVLAELKKRKIECIVISYQSFLTKNYAHRKLRQWLKHFGISSYVSEIHLAHKQTKTKDKLILELLKAKGIEKKEALFVGDRYELDYLAGKKAGIETFLLNRPENARYKVKKIDMKELVRCIT